MNNEDIKLVIKDALVKTKYKLSDDILVQIPKDPNWGDYSSNVAMILAKQYNQDPIKIAEKIVKNISNKYIYVEIVKPGFINFKFDQKIYLKNLFEVLDKKSNYGKVNIGKGKVITMDFSSPNIAKPMSVGHLRSTVIGDSIGNLYRTLGYKVVGINHLGDWGTQFGKLLYAYKKWYKSNTKIDLSGMLKLYVKFHKEAKKDDQLEEFAREEFRKLEKNDGKNLKIWKEFRAVSLKEFEKIYKQLNVFFDEVVGESFYNDMLESIVQEALDKKIAKKSLGAIVIDVDEKLPPVLLRKKDKATLYATRDLATIKYRDKKYHPEKMLYIIGNEQKLYLKQLFLASDKLQFSKAELVHVGFGLVRMKEGKMSTREGRVVYLQDLIDKAYQKAYDIVSEKNSKMSLIQKENIAKKVAIGAIKYNDLSQNPNTDILFDYDKMLSLQGNSAPYLMYTYARAKSILSKANSKNDLSLTDLQKVNGLKINIYEENILKMLSKYKQVIILSAEKYQSNFLCEYLFKIANEFNNFYQNNPVLNAKKETRKLRLAIVEAVGNILKNGLDVLGIDVLEKM